MRSLLEKHMRVRQLVIRPTLLVAVASFVPALALAQPASTGMQPYPAACSTVPPAASDLAHVLYQAGKAYYDEANYDLAIPQFREAYRKDCTKHDLLIIISRSYELKSDRPAAIDALEEYLRRVPNSPDAQQHRTRIENLRKQLAPSTPSPRTTAMPAPAAPPVAPVRSPEERIREHTVAPWVVVGLGGAAAVAGAVVLTTAPANPEGCDASTETCKPIPGESTAAYNKRQSDAGVAKNQPIIGAVVLGSGGALLVGGLLWHFLEPTGPQATSSAGAKVTPQVSPGFAGLSLGGSF